ncbi:MAG: hypothetical protein ACE5Z5_09095 [Candidatus Bathyarchaeia archaeon]
MTPNALLPGGVEAAGSEVFRRVLLEAVDEGLADTLGNTAKEAVLYYLERNYKVRRGEILGNLDGFASGLEAILGAGAGVVERAILERLYTRCGLGFEVREDFSFSDYVEDARRRTSYMRVVRGGEER